MLNNNTRKTVDSGGTGRHDNRSRKSQTGRLKGYFRTTICRRGSLRENIVAQLGKRMAHFRLFGIFEDRKDLASGGLSLVAKYVVLKVGLEPTQSFPHMPLNFSSTNRYFRVVYICLHFNPP